METNIIQVIVQGGSVGLCILLIWVVYKLVSNHDVHLLEALNRNTDAWSKNEIALTRLIDRLENIKN